MSSTPASLAESTTAPEAALAPSPADYSGQAPIAAKGPIVLDFSLALANQTGAYYLGLDIATELFTEFSAIRYWRVTAKAPPKGLVRKVLAKAMFVEMDARIKQARFPKARTRAVYLDPLYVLNGGVSADDVVLCHDLGPLTHPDLYHSTSGYEAAYRMIAAAKPGMVFVSEASRDAFVVAFGTDFRFLRVIPLYVRSNITNGAAEAPDFAPPRFLLCVGAVGRRKNQRGLIEAYKLSGLHNEGVSLVIVGAREFGFEEVLTAAADVPGVVVAPYTSEPQLRWLYAHAAAFCLPSLLEGFGMPALEAVDRGLIGVLSRGGALEEAVGSNAILVDPTSPAEIAEGLKRAVHIPENERAALIDGGRRHALALSRARFITAWRDLVQAERAEQS